MSQARCGTAAAETDPSHRRVNEESILAVQIFDQKKFKKKDQGFLGVVNIRIGSVIDLDAGGDGRSRDS
jgi:E3 ubiquitin-protein ligase NEDD4